MFEIPLLGYLTPEISELQNIQEKCEEQWHVRYNRSMYTACKKTAQCFSVQQLFTKILTNMKIHYSYLFLINTMSVLFIFCTFINKYLSIFVQHVKAHHFLDIPEFILLISAAVPAVSFDSMRFPMTVHVKKYMSKSAAKQ
jgi:hypothetical protein